MDPLVVTNVSLWGSMLIVGEAAHVCRQGVYGNCVPYVQFFCEPKTALEKKNV